MRRPVREVRRAADRFVTMGDGTRTWHSFSYGRHYDPANVGLGAVQAVNVEHVAPGAGYDEHHHADVEIVTWVLAGALAHADTTGASGVVRPGTAQRLSAGRGVRHAERNASQAEELVFVQMMLRSDHGGEPRYATAHVEGEGLLETVDVAAPARLLVARPAGASLALPASARTLVHVTRGTVLVGEQALDTGDELRTDEALPGLSGGGEALVWLLA